MALIGSCPVLSFRAQITTKPTHYAELYRTTPSVWSFLDRFSDISQVECAKIDVYFTRLTERERKREAPAFGGQSITGFEL